MKTTKRSPIGMLFAHVVIFVRLLLSGGFGVRDAWVSADEALDLPNRKSVIAKDESQAHCRSFVIAHPRDPNNVSKDRRHDPDWPSPIVMSHSGGQVKLPFYVERQFLLSGELLDETVTLQVGSMKIQLCEADWASIPEVIALRAYARETVEKNPV